MLRVISYSILHHITLALYGSTANSANKNAYECETKGQCDALRGRRSGNVFTSQREVPLQFGKSVLSEELIYFN